MTAPVLDAALWYAHLGWRVMPLHLPVHNGCSCGREDCTAHGKHPRIKGWVKNASVDTTVIKRWFGHMWPNSNIGLLTGAASGVVALDIDPKHGGEYSLEALEAEHDALPETVEAETGSGGRHILFTHPGFEIRPRGGMRPGLDFRGDGGMIVVAPSLHACGRRYVWLDGHGPHEIALAPAPAWLLALIIGPDGRKPTSAMRVHTLASNGVAEGQRNDSIARMSGHLLRHYVDPEVTLDLMLAWNSARCRPPLDEDEVVRTVDSICAKELRRREAST